MLTLFADSLTLKEKNVVLRYPMYTKSLSSIRLLRSFNLHWYLLRVVTVIEQLWSISCPLDLSTSLPHRWVRWGRYVIRFVGSLDLVDEPTLGETFFSHLQRMYPRSIGNNSILNV